MIGLDQVVLVVGSPGAPGSVVVSRLPGTHTVEVDDALVDDPERIVALAKEHASLRFVLLVRHPFATLAAATDAAEAEAEWVDVTGGLVDIAEQLGPQRCLLARWEDVDAGDADHLLAFLDAREPAGPAERPLIAAESAPSARLGRAARALARELRYDLDSTTTAAATPEHPGRDVIRAGSHADRVPASSAQQRLLFVEDVDGGAPVHHLPSIRRIHGPIDVAALERALADVVARHETLRTDYELADGEWIQIVRPAGAVPLAFDDLSDVAAADRDEAVAAAVAAEVRRPFDLRRGLKLRARLIRVDHDLHLVVITLHHIAADGWSIVQLTTDLSACYAAAVQGRPAELDPLPLRYVDYTLWQREQAQSPEFAAQVEFWRHTLDGTLPVLDLPTDRARPAVFDHAAGSVPIEFDVGSAWRNAARAVGVTPFMFLLASYAATLARWTGADDIVIGTANANRRGETDRLVGLFASTLPIRLAVDVSAPFAELAAEVKRAMLAALANQDVPFDEIVRVVNPPRSRSHAPVFQTLFVLNNMRGAVIGEVEGVAVDELTIAPTAVELDVSVVVEEGAHGLFGRIDFASALFDESTIARFVAHWGRLLDAAAADPAVAVDDLPIMSPAELDVVAHEFASPFEWPSAIEGITRIDELFALRALADPDAVAFEYRGDVVTYAECDRRANQVARRLQAAGVAPGDRVGVAVARSTAMVVAVLSALKCGAAYVPLDPDLPTERLRYMIADAEVGVALTSPGALDRVVADDIALTLIDVVAEADQLAALDPAPLRVDTSDQPGGGAAWVIYTSGSTGRPKGVEVEHASGINFLLGMLHQPGITADDVVLAVPTLSFDPSVLDLFLPALAGARVVVSARDDIVDGVRLAELIDASGATIMQATPTTWSMLLKSGWRGAPRLTALCGGEAMPTELARRLLEGCRSVWNIYGPTETTVWSTAHQVTEESLRHVNVPIGRPIPNLVYRVVDAHDQLVPVGVPGEVLIGGAGVARGYLNRPDLTAERFVTDPFDPNGRVYRTGDIARWLPTGDLEFFGRRDFQVKLHGNRIELGEIEAALRELDGVTDAVVVALGDATTMRLVAYLTLAPGVPARRPAELRAALQQRLPAPMIPSNFVVVDAFPLTPSGKIDRNALPAPAVADVHAGVEDQPRDPLERSLSELFARVLERPSVGIHDDFFELGGYSLMALRLFAGIEAETGRRIPLATLFDAPTVATLAAVIRRDASAPASGRATGFGHLVAIQTGGDRLPFFCVHGSGGNVLNFRDLSVALGPEQPFYGLQARGIDGATAPHASIAEMAAAYVDEVKDVYTGGPYVLGGYSGGGLVALEMAHLLTEMGSVVGMVVLLDTFPPVIPPANDPVRARIARLREEGLDYLRFVVRRRRQAAAYGAALRRLDSITANGEVVPPELREAYVDRAFITAARAYELRRYTDPVTLIRVEKLHFGVRSLGAAYGWDEVVADGALDVVRVPGGHDDLVLQPHAGRVADAVRAAIDRAAELRP